MRGLDEKWGRPVKPLDAPSAGPSFSSICLYLAIICSLVAGFLCSAAMGLSIVAGWALLISVATDSKSERPKKNVWPPVKGDEESRGN